MIKVSVTSNYKALSKSLDRLGKKQLPFAFSQTLNGTMFRVRQETVTKTYPRSFSVRNARFFNSIMRVGKATKTNLEVSLFDKVGRDYLERHTSGGVKIPKTGRLAIPSKDQLTKRTARGFRNTQRPRTIIDKPKGFIGKLKSGQPAILERKTKKSYPLRVVYILEQSAFIKKTFPFYKDAKRVTKQVSGALFKKHFAEAIRTARR